jgi:tetratricopeptide (TPR) repeat protein
VTKFKRALWNELHNLSPTEKEMIARFEQAPQGPAFPAVSELLRKRGYLAESIVVLEEGLRAFPHFHSARAALAKDLFQKGLVADALENVTQVLKNTPDNLMAQRLRLRIGLVQSERKACEDQLESLRRLSPDDDFTRTVRARMSCDDFVGARALVMADLQRQGIVVAQSDKTNTVAPQQEGHNVGLSGTELTTAHTHDLLSAFRQQESWHLPERPLVENASEKNSVPPRDFAHFDMESALQVAGVRDEKLPEALSSEGTLAHVRGDVERYVKLRAFRMMSRRQALGKEDETLSGAPFGREMSAPLDKTTLLELYESQGHFQKALEVCEELFKEHPDSPTWQARCERLRMQARETLLQGNSSGSVQLKTREEKIQKLEKLLWKWDSLA